jgi:hypothetical protein
MMALLRKQLRENEELERRERELRLEIERIQREQVRMSSAFFFVADDAAKLDKIFDFHPSLIFVSTAVNQP